jgi:nucleoside-diphosphate-sugar epimerase
MINKNAKILIPGAAGLVGQNLIIMLKENGYNNLIAIDKHKANIKILRKIHPDINIFEADLSENGDWEKEFKDGKIIIMLQAQIGASTVEPFLKNNIESTKKILGSAKKYKIPYIIHISSSVVISVADDNYTNTKKAQEQLVTSSGIPSCVLRPPLMFGWFDRKHLGWLSRFMEKVPVYPIPGNGRFLRQPLYVRDLCKVIIKCIEKMPKNKIYNIIGRENINYIDIVRMVKRVKNLKIIILKIPYVIFYLLLKIYALFINNPPFTADQLKALTAGDKFEVFNWWDEFDIVPTEIQAAMEETFNHPEYSKYILEF